MNTSLRSSVQDYLGAVDRLRDLPRTRRRELLADLHAHIEGELGTRPDATDAEIESVLDELGTPEEIANAARREIPTAPKRMGAHEIFAIILLLVGGLIVPFVGWIVGVVLLWTSTAWRTRDKLLGTLLVPGGLMSLGLGFVAVGASSRSCVSSAVAGQRVVEHCTGGGGPSAVVSALAIAGLVVGVVGPIFTAGWLAVHARRPLA